MNIRFTSSLTPEDENLLAPALIKAFTSILDLLPIAYVIRIDTSDSNVFQHSATEPDASRAIGLQPAPARAAHSGAAHSAGAHGGVARAAADRGGIR
jgi:hypothetical protein